MATRLLCVCDHCDKAASVESFGGDLPFGWSVIDGRMSVQGPSMRSEMESKADAYGLDDRTKEQMVKGMLFAHGIDDADEPAVEYSHWRLELCDECSAAFPDIAASAIHKAIEGATNDRKMARRRRIRR